MVVSRVGSDWASLLGSQHSHQVSALESSRFTTSSILCNFFLTVSECKHYDGNITGISDGISPKRHSLPAMNSSLSQGRPSPKQISPSGFRKNFLESVSEAERSMFSSCSPTVELLKGIEHLAGTIPKKNRRITKVLKSVQAFLYRHPRTLLRSCRHCHFVTSRCGCDRLKPLSPRSSGIRRSKQVLCFLADSTTAGK